MIESTQQRDELVIREDDKSRLVLTIQQPDPYSKKYYLTLESTIYDEYNKKWLQPRNTKLLLTEAELAGMTSWLLAHRKSEAQ